MSRPVYPPGSAPAYAPIRPHVQHYTTVRPESVYDPQQARPHPYLPRQTPIHTPDQIAEIHYRNQQLSVARHVSQPMHPQEAIPPPASATGAYHPQSGPVHPVAGPSTRVNQHPAHSYPHPQPTEVSYPVNQPHHPPAPPPGGPGRMTAVPFETLARIVNRMDAVHLSIEERMGKIEDAAKLTNGVAERLEKVESELKANRDKATQEHMSIVTFLDGMSSRFSQRLKIVGDRIERVERGLGPNYFEDTPLPSGSESLATDKLYSGNSVMDKLKNMECLLMELLEKANDPDAYKSEVITEDKGINTDVVHRANAETQCRPPPERCEVAVGESIDSGDFSSAIGTEEHNGRTGLLMNYPAVSGGIVANPQLAAALATPETSELQANLHPATWREEPLSDLSSRSTSPGLTVDELRRMLALKVQAQATANPTGSSSPEASLPRGGTSATSSVPPQTHVPLEQLPSPQPSTPPSPISPVASHTSRLSHDIPLPVFASSDAVSILLEGGNTRSSSLEYVDHQRSSVERLFDDDEDVEYATPEKTKPAEAEKLVEYVPAREGPESEEELDMRGEHIHEASHNVQQSPPASARVPARRRRSPSADSLSSLSTIPSSSPSSSTAVERQIIWSDSLPAPIARPPKKKRRTEPAVSTESSTSALDHLLKKKGSTKKNKQKNEWEKSSKWEVVYGYNGPCDWPELNDDDALYENLLSCDECDCWYHWGCVGLDKDDPQITSEEEPFTCPPCKVSMEKHGIARKVRHTHSGECARPGCTRNLDTGVFFLERVIGRRPANLKVIPPEHPWLFKWADYSPREATWEPEASFPPGRDKFIAEFEDAALAAGLPFDDLDEMILLPEAVEAGWPNINGYLNR